MEILETINKEISGDLKLLNTTIAESLISSNELLNTVVDSYLTKKGKQIRPILTILSARLTGTTNSNTINGGAAIELLHNASLIHDDVVDDSHMRRNVPTINHLWDNQVAVLVGDFFVTTALDRAIATDNMKIVRSICSLGRRLALGELDQIDNARNNLLDEDAYMRVISRKTASLFVACAEIGCASVEAGEKETETLKEFSRLLGLCFQIKDDTFDYIKAGGNSIGKPTANDLREGKVSLPLLHVLINDKKNGKFDMIELCCKDELTNSEIDTLISYAANNGGIEYANRVMENLYVAAVELLKQFPESTDRTNLELLFRYVIDRKH